MAYLQINSVDNSLEDGLNGNSISIGRHLKRIDIERR